MTDLGESPTQATNEIILIEAQRQQIEIEELIEKTFNREILGYNEKNVHGAQERFTSKTALRNKIKKLSNAHLGFELDEHMRKLQQSDAAGIWGFCRQ